MLVFNLFCLPVKLISLFSFNNYGIPSPPRSQFDDELTNRNQVYSARR